MFKILEGSSEGIRRLWRKGFVKEMSFTDYSNFEALRLLTGHVGLNVCLNLMLSCWRWVVGVVVCL